MKEIKVLEGKVVAPEGMKVGIVASRFNEIIVNKLLSTIIFLPIVSSSVGTNLSEIVTGIKSEFPLKRGTSTSKI